MQWVAAKRPWAGSCAWFSTIDARAKQHQHDKVWPPRKPSKVRVSNTCQNARSETVGRAAWVGVMPGDVVSTVPNGGRQEVLAAVTDSGLR